MNNDDNIRSPDEAYMDTLYSPVIPSPRKKRRQRNVNIQNYHIPDTPQHYANNQYDDMNLDDEAIMREIMEMSVKEYEMEINQKEEDIIQMSMEESKQIEERRYRESMYLTSERKIVRLSKIDMEDKMYSSILLYIRLFIDSGKTVIISGEEYMKICRTLQNIRLTDKERADILAIFIYNTTNSKL